MQSSRHGESPPACAGWQVGLAQPHLPVGHCRQREHNDLCITSTEPFKGRRDGNAYGAPSFAFVEVLPVAYSKNEIWSLVASAQSSS
jgi:hypothetical protein